MPRYEVTIPVVTRREEVHYVDADSEREAIEETRYREPDADWEDQDVYDVLYGHAQVRLLDPTPE